MSFRLVGTGNDVTACVLDGEGLIFLLSINWPKYSILVFRKPHLEGN